MILPSVAIRAPFKLRNLRILIAVFILCMAHGQDAVNSDCSRDTDEHVKDPGWWPTKGTAARSEFAGSASCVACHKGIAELQKKTPMSMAASLPADASILRQHGDLRFVEGNDDYTLTSRGDATTFLVKDQGSTLSVPVTWAIGNGEIGQTYLLKQNGTYYESRLSYFPGLPGLDITPGHSLDVPKALEQSLGNPLDLSTVTRCFGCHTTASAVSGKFDPEHASPGVGCEACHGPGAEHIKAVKQGNNPASEPLDPDSLSPVDSVDFCGACHRTPADVADHMSEHLGLISIRFQPYRLERSLCWGASGDARITCIACHDPHKPLVKVTASYDSKCLQCHAGADRPVKANQAPACTVASKDCASCHMPRYEIKLAHATFTDHYIHVVRPGSQFRE